MKKKSTHVTRQTYKLTKYLHKDPQKICQLDRLSAWIKTWMHWILKHASTEVWVFSMLKMNCRKHNYQHENWDRMMFYASRLRSRYCSLTPRLMCVFFSQLRFFKHVIWQRHARVRILFQVSRATLGHCRAKAALNTQKSTLLYDVRKTFGMLQI